MDARIIELEDEVEQTTQIINSLIQRIEKLEARPVLYQRRSTSGDTTGLVYAQGQNALHEPVELEHIRNKVQNT
jgi:hypothetical protein